MNDRTIEWKDFLEKNRDFDVIVNENQMETVLNDLGNEADQDNFIVDSDTKERVTSKDEDDIKLGQVGVVATGSKVFIKKNVASFREFLIEKNK